VYKEVELLQEQRSSQNTELESQNTQNVWSNVCALCWADLVWNGQECLGWFGLL